MLENMLQMSGVQLVLKNLVAAAAPQLVEQANQIGDLIRAFKDTVDRIEADQKIIMQHLHIGENGNGHRSGIDGVEIQNNGAGKQAGE